MRHAARWPATGIGVFSLTVFVLASVGLVPFSGITRVLILPAYLVHLLWLMAVAAVPGDPSGWVEAVTMPLRLVPFVLVDLSLQRLPARLTRQSHLRNLRSRHREFHEQQDTEKI